jgi:peptidyl-prolyl cis-trans isomerase SurA
MMALRTRLLKCGLACLAALIVLSTVLTTNALAAVEIRYVVNGIPVTNYDIERRAAFLRLQRRSPSAAKDDMIDQALRASELRRLNIRVPDQAVDQAYERFASQNKLSVSQLNTILAQSGVTREHFREFIRVQIGWSQALSARYRAEGRLSEQDAVQRMLQQGGQKPTATEYLLQQVIFVIPAAERASSLARRKREAEALRQRFAGCDSTREFVKGLIDVTVRDLGRVLAPELPPDWEKFIKETKPGNATPVRETDRGIEFIGICSTREVSDDRVARMIFQNDGAPEQKADELAEKYMKELREKSRIVER